MKSLSSKLPNILVQRASWLNDLNHLLHTILPDEMHAHVQIASLNRGILTLEADTPAWAAKLRYRGRDISNQLSAKSGLTIRSAKVLIQPQASLQPPAKRAPVKLPTRSAMQIQTLADTMAHPGLKRALANLAKRANSK